MQDEDLLNQDLLNDLQSCWEMHLFPGCRPALQDLVTKAMIKRYLTLDLVSIPGPWTYKKFMNVTKEIISAAYTSQCTAPVDEIIEWCYQMHRTIMLLEGAMCQKVGWENATSNFSPVPHRVSKIVEYQKGLL